MPPAYIVVTPTRDEEATVETTIRSMLSQTVRPLRWVLVNDGSTDGTRALLANCAAAHDWVELVDRADRGSRALGGGVVEAFYAGFERVRELPWEFVVKLDADLSFEPEYFERMLGRFEADPRLGMASGKTFLETAGGLRIEYCHDEHVRGPAKMYRRRCFEDIGGLEAVRGWDIIDEVQARIQGWDTRSFEQERIMHLRPIDGRQRRVLRSRYGMGRLYHHLGYDPLYMLVRGARSALQDYPRVLGGGMLVAGYVAGFLTRQEQRDPEFLATLRRSQRARFRISHFRKFLRSSRRP